MLLLSLTGDRGGGVRCQPVAPPQRTLDSILNFILVFSWLSALCSLPRHRPPLACCRLRRRGGGTRTGTAPEAHPKSPRWTGPSQPTTAWTEMRPAQGRRSAAALENAPEHHVQDSFVLSPLFISHLSLDDVEEEIRVAAAAQEVSQTEGLVQGLHLILDLGWRSARWTPDHEQKQSCDEGKYSFSRNNVDKRGKSGVLLRVQAGEL